MIDDPIIEELHRVKDELAERFAGDTHSLFEFLREREAAEGRPVVMLEPAAGRRPDGATAPRRGETAPEHPST
jgi:hypothetical protein